MKRIRLHIKHVLLTILAMGGFFLVAWFVAPYCVEDPFPKLAEQTPTRSWYDRNGRVLWHERTYDGQWRFPVPLEKVSPHVIRVILATEDADFYKHSGVNYASAFRAVFQNLFAARRVSGASTISMQLAGLTLPGRHTYARKFLQAAKARKLERCHTKDEILTEYLNRILFGGKIYGIEAAAQYYFGMSAEKLNLAEATYLCGLPQRPNRYRPDRFPERAKERQRTVLRLLVHHGYFSEEEAHRVLYEEPLRLRDFRYPAGFELHRNPEELLHAFRDETNTRTSLDIELQSKVHEILEAHRRRMHGVKDAAALVVDNASGEVLVYVGTLDFDSPEAGEVDAIPAVRSAGSTLKPFIYAEACAGGLLVAETKLKDAPFRMGNYAPGNYDSSFVGEVSAREALSYSLNTPVARLVAQLGADRMLQRLDDLGLSSGTRDHEKEHPGISLALGTDGSTLWNLTRAYTMLAREGSLVELTLAHGREAQLRDAEALPMPVCVMISSMLRSRPFHLSGVDAAWKTGTSNNHCDAWCFAYTPEYTLGVWFGNKSGRPSEDLVGASAAIPVASEIMAFLYRERPQPQWTSSEAVLELRTLCEKTGLTVGPHCTAVMKEYAIPGLPLRRCEACRAERRPAFQILSPIGMLYQPAPGKTNVVLTLSTNGESVDWYLNNRKIGRNLSEYAFPAEGRYTLRAVEVLADPATPPRSSAVHFSVTK